MSLPELEDVVDALSEEGEYILDGETIPLKNGERVDFSHVMTRFGRDDDIDEQETETEFKFFDRPYGYHPDHEYLRSSDLSNKETHERDCALTWSLPENPEYRVSTAQPDDAQELEERYQSVVNRGYEGGVIKRVDSGYEYNKRSSNWRKIIPEKGERRPPRGRDD